MSKWSVHECESYPPCVKLILCSLALDAFSISSIGVFVCCCMQWALMYRKRPPGAQYSSLDCNITTTEAMAFLEVLKKWKRGDPIPAECQIYGLIIVGGNHSTAAKKKASAAHPTNVSFQVANCRVFWNISDVEQRGVCMCVCSLFGSCLLCFRFGHTRPPGFCPKRKLPMVFVFACRLRRCTTRSRKRIQLSWTRGIVW